MSPDKENAEKPAAEVDTKEAIEVERKKRQKDKEIRARIERGEFGPTVDDNAGKRVIR